MPPLPARLPTVVLVVALLVASLTAGAPPQRAAAGPGDPSFIFGTAFDAVTNAPLADVCVVLGPALIRCITRTAPDGSYRIDFPPGDVITSEQELHFLARERGYQDYDSPHFVVRGATRQDAPMLKVGATPATRCDTPGEPTQTLFLPNVTKTLGGPGGWQTPFIVQNTGTVPTTLEVSFYSFTVGALVVCRKVANLQAGTSFADVPNNDGDLPGNSQFSVVVRSFGATVVSVVNEHAGTAERAEAMAYTGYAAGASSVFLPNITRRFFGFVTPFIIQNLGPNPVIAQARFKSFDGTAPEVVVERSMLGGRSAFVDPNSAPGLVDGKQYSVTVTAGGPVGVVVNSHNDAATVASPVAYSANGIVGGGPVLYGAYAAKNAQGVGRVSTIVVQNMGSDAASPLLAFRPLGGGTAKVFELGSIAPGASRAFDPRYENGDVRLGLCGSGASGLCLADGEHSFMVTLPSGATGSLAAAVNVLSPATAMGYSAQVNPSRRVFLPNVTRTLGGAGGWTTPIVVQSASAQTAQLSFYRFSDQRLVLTQPLMLTPGDSVRVDPRDLGTLSDDTQYSVVVDGADGTLSAIVIELATGGDSAMIYEGFPATP